MPQLIAKPVVIDAAGSMPKRIEEFAGRVRTGTAAVSVARMVSPPGWREPAQTPEFDEVTLVLKGVLRVDGPDGALDVRAGEAVLARAGETVRYSTPGPEGAEYVAVCAPAFSPALVHRHGEASPDVLADAEVEIHGKVDADPAVPSRPAHELEGGVSEDDGPSLPPR